MARYTLTNANKQDVILGKIKVRANGSLGVDVITPAIVRAVAAKKLTCSPSIADVTHTMSTVTYSGGGTASTITAQARTIASISGTDATATAAIAAAFDELNRARLAIVALASQINENTAAIRTMQDLIDKK